MNFDLSEEHLMIKQAARDFAQNELKDGLLIVILNVNILKNKLKEWLN
jgi:hypothetical protein